jgi:hypothetical protein
MQTSPHIKLPEGLRAKNKEVLGFHKLIGKSILVARLENNNRNVVFETSDGQLIRFKVAHDWYTTAWVAHYEKPSDLFGAKIMHVVNSGFVQEPGSYELEDKKVYSTSLVTTKGYITFEFRNSGKYGYGGYFVNA